MTHKQTLNKIQLEECLKITNKLKDAPISIQFIDLVDKSNKDYYKKIQRPICINMVLSKLKNGEYATVEEWRNDVNRIWENAKKYNDSRFFLYHIANELSAYFKELSSNIPSTPYQKWARTLEKAQDKLNRLINSCPEHYIPVEDSRKPVKSKSSK